MLSPNAEPPRGMAATGPQGIHLVAPRWQHKRAFLLQPGGDGKSRRTNRQRSCTFAEVGIEQRLNNQVPLDLKFRDETGQTVTLGSYFSRGPVILSLVYYTCTMMCTLTEHSLVNSLRDVKANIGEQYQVVTVSFDPTETPELARATESHLYGTVWTAWGGQGWHFLVGDQPSIQALTRAVGFRYRYMMDMDEFEHATGNHGADAEGQGFALFPGH